LDPPWDLTLSVPAGALTLSGTAGLTGSGDGTGTLQYRGTLPALNAALEGLRYTPLLGFQGQVVLTIAAHSAGAAPLQGRLTIGVGVHYAVTTTADSGPGSLRQAILEANATPGTIDFAIPGPGVQTIVPTASLPPIISPVLIDGFSQPGSAGTPLIE